MRLPSTERTRNGARKVTRSALSLGLWSLAVLGLSHNGVDPATPYAVSVVSDPNLQEPASPLYAPGDSDPSCLANAASSGHLTAVFPRHDLCASLPNSSSPILSDDIVIWVDTDRVGQVVAVLVDGQDVRGTEGVYHQSELLEVTPDSVEALPDGSFIVHVHADEVALWKCDTHVSGKETVCDELVGSFAIDDLIYTPDP